LNLEWNFSMAVEAVEGEDIYDVSACTCKCGLCDGVVKYRPQYPMNSKWNGFSRSMIG